MALDLVYTFVNGSDEAWLKRRNQFAIDNNNAVCRFRNNDELKYSLRSVEKYAPWIRKIHIVLDGSVPDWLDASDSRLDILESREILPAESLPCYNSNVIESFLDRIPGLSDIFLYANDDMFFGNYVGEDFFVSGGKPLIRMAEGSIVPKSYYYTALFHSQKMIFDRFGVRFDLRPTHCVDVYSKEGIRKCREEFAEDFGTALNNHIRTDTDIQRVIFHYYMILKDMCVLKTYKGESLTFFDKLKKLVFSGKYLDFKAYTIDMFFHSKGGLAYFIRKPRLFCLNDSENTTERDLIKYRRLMELKFPKKSSFEK